MEESPVNSPDQAGFADINNNRESKTTSDKSIDSPEGKAFSHNQIIVQDSKKLSSN